ncbi:hypothetical protein BC831DRAFT_75081 [Entophlyctis helioformis]|nr:hypothetical protein BC831DRAFT_75081 [Entophlyctis helioformis]
MLPELCFLICCWTVLECCFCLIIDSGIKATFKPYLTMNAVSRFAFACGSVGSSKAVSVKPCQSSRRSHQVGQSWLGQGCVDDGSRHACDHAKRMLPVWSCWTLSHPVPIRVWSARLAAGCGMSLAILATIQRARQASKQAHTIDYTANSQQQTSIAALD